MITQATQAIFTENTTTRKFCGTIYIIDNNSKVLDFIYCNNLEERKFATQTKKEWESKTEDYPLYDMCQIALKEGFKPLGKKWSLVHKLGVLNNTINPTRTKTHSMEKELVEYYNKNVLSK